LALPGVNIGGGNFQRRRWRTLRWLAATSVSMGQNATGRRIDRILAAAAALYRSQYLVIPVQ